MGRDYQQAVFDRGRRKKLIRAFWFIQGEGVLDELCAKDRRGNCTGKATAPWRIGSELIKECPGPIIIGSAQIIHFYNRYKLYGLPYKPWPKMPYRWLHILTLLEMEAGKIQKARMDDRDYSSWDELQQAIKE